jgi:hypothetical protein
MAFHYRFPRARHDAIARFADYRGAARLLSQHPTFSHCEALTKLVTPNWYERVYLPRLPNIHLVRNKPLPGDLLGLVVRRNFEWRGQYRSAFLIQVAPQVSSFAEHFVIAHELGHVLAHGSLMYAGMVISEPAWDSPEEEDDRRQLVELEANICALMAIVPHVAIDALATVLGRPVTACSLQYAMQWLSGEPFDHQLARERLLLHATLEGTVRLEDFVYVVCGNERSWTFNGAAALGTSQHESSTCKERISLALLKTWLALLFSSGIVTADEWPCVRRLIADGGNRPLMLHSESAARLK